MDYSKQDIIAGELGAPPIMRASITAPRGTMALVTWSDLFNQPLLLVPGMPLNLSFMKPVAVRVQNFDAVLSYLKAALPPRTGAARFLSVTPVVPVTTNLIGLGTVVSEATFRHALQMLGIVLYPSGEVKIGYTL